MPDGSSIDPYCQNGENLLETIECKTNEKCFKTRIKEGSNVLVSRGCSIEYSKNLCPYTYYISTVKSEVQPVNIDGECHYCETELCNSGNYVGFSIITLQMCAAISVILALIR